MPYPRPTRETILRRAYSDLEAAYPSAGVRIPGHPARVEAAVSAELAHHTHGHVANAVKQMFPHLCDDRFVGEWMRVYKVSDGAGGFGRLRPTRASGTVTFTLDGSASPIPVATAVQIGERRYTVTDGAVPLAGDLTAQVTIQATENGAAYNVLETGTAAELVAPIAGVSGAVVDTVISGGADVESVTAARTRLLAAIRAANSGGGPGDYVAWARNASQLVTRAWEIARYTGPGTMRVLIANDNESPPVADADLVTTVQNYLQKTEVSSGGWTKITGVAPATAVVTVASVGTKALPVTASVELETGEVFDDGAGGGVRALVEIEIAALIALRAEPGETITVEEISGAIQRAPGVRSHTLTAPAADVTHTALEIPVVGTHTLTEAP